MSPVGFSSALNHEGFEPGAGISRDRRLAFDLRRSWRLVTAAIPANLCASALIVLPLYSTFL